MLTSTYHDDIIAINRKRNDSPQACKLAKESTTPAPRPARSDRLGEIPIDQLINGTQRRTARGTHQDKRIGGRLPTQSQMFTCFYLLQSFSNTLCSIQVFRYDRKQETVYILAENSLGEEIQISVNRTGKWRFIDDQTRL